MFRVIALTKIAELRKDGVFYLRRVTYLEDGVLETSSTPTLVISGGMERAVRLQRPRPQHISMRSPRRRHNRPVPISVLHPGYRRSDQTLREVKSQRGLIRSTNHLGVRGRAEVF